MLAAAKRVEAAESAAAILQKELAAMAPPPDPSSTLALPPASNLELRVYESLGLDAAIGKSCVQQQKQNTNPNVKCELDDDDTRSAISCGP